MWRSLPAVLRALVACGWFGIQTWIGGEAIYKICVTIFHLHPEPATNWLGITLPDTPPVQFPGDVPVFADPVGGPVTDLNVMIRRGRFDCRLERRIAPASVRLTPRIIRFHLDAVREALDVPRVSPPQSVKTDDAQLSFDDLLSN